MPTQFRSKGRGRNRKVYPISTTTPKRRRTMTVAQVQNLRSPHAIQIDNSMRSKIVSEKEWKTDPSRGDLKGIDTPASKREFSNVEKFVLSKSERKYIEKYAPTRQEAIKTGMIPDSKGFVNLPNTNTREHRNFSVPVIRKNEESFFEPYLDKNVTVVLKSGKEIDGKIVKASDGNLIFMRKGQRSKGLYPTAGVFDGFRNTITIRKIKPKQSFPDKYYIVRRWDDGEKKQYAHFYPRQNGMAPDGFKTKKDAQNYLNKWGSDGKKIVTSAQADNYEIPLRY